LCIFDVASGGGEGRRCCRGQRTAHVHELHEVQEQFSQKLQTLFLLVSFLGHSVETFRNEKPTCLPIIALATSPVSKAKNTPIRFSFFFLFLIRNSKQVRERKQNHRQFLTFTICRKRDFQVLSVTTPLPNTPRNPPTPPGRL